MQILTAALLILIGVLFFGFIIFFHELGHFLLAKASGIRVNEFALGMGPKLFGFRKGETQYSLRLLPIGGYCAMEGEDEDSGDPRAFGNKPVWKRFLVVAAGSVFNIVLGFFLMMIVLGQQDVFTTTQIASFTEDSALQAAGAQVGDTIVEVDGYAIYTDRDLNFALVLADPAAVSMVVERDGQRVDLGTFALKSQTLEDGSTMVSLDFYVEPEAVTFSSLIRRSAADTFSMVRMAVETLKGLFTGRFGLNDVAGPIGTAQAIGQAASAGLAGSNSPVYGSPRFSRIHLICLKGLGFFGREEIPVKGCCYETAHFIRRNFSALFCGDRTFQPVFPLGVEYCGGNYLRHRCV